MHHLGQHSNAEGKCATGEMLVGPKNTLFLDEISTGLDSSTTYLIVKCMRNVSHMTQVCISSCPLVLQIE